MDLRRSERIPDRVTFLLIELPVDAGRRGYMDCVPINIVVVVNYEQLVSQDELAFTNQAEYGDSKTCSGEHFPSI